jgi:GTP-binding protein HflX
LEVDRRRIRDRIADLKRELVEVRRHRQTQRLQRKKREIPVIALVGYTNAGKSSLLRAILNRFGTGLQSSIEGRNRLFDTLDPTSRKIELPNGGAAVLIDTVGFIQQLPHQLVDAFRATLEETVQADLLLHVVDVSHPGFDVQMGTVYDVLQELEVGGKTIVTVFNKIDLVPDKLLPDDPRSNHTVRASSMSGEGIPELIAWITRWINRSSIRMTVVLPFTEGNLISRLHGECRIFRHDFLENGVLLDIEAKPEFFARLEKFRV